MILKQIYDLDQAYIAEVKRLQKLGNIEELKLLKASYMVRINALLDAGDAS